MKPAEQLVWLDTCGSTNDEAWARAATGIRAVAAAHQSRGRGRRGRTWHSPPGAGLYFSFVARPRFGQNLGAALPLMAAAAAAELVSGLGVEPVLKWPNDLLVGDRKLAGVLCEARGTAATWTAVVGIGLNVRTPDGGWPEDVPGVALDALVADPPSPKALAEALLPRLEAWLSRVEHGGLAPVIEAWHRHAPPAGTRLRQGAVEGAFVGLAPDGALRLRTAGGREALIHAGEVELVASAPAEP